MGYYLTKIAIISISICLSALFARFIKQSLIPAYVLAGVFLGPTTGIVTYVELQDLAQLAILSMLFSAGISVNVPSFVKKGPVALGVILIQLAFGITTFLVLSSFIPQFTGQTMHLILLWAFIWTLSSTACAYKLAECMGYRINSKSLCILVVQDIALSAMIMTLNAVKDPALFSYFALSKDIAINLLLLALVLIASIRNSEKMVMPNNDASKIGLVTWCVTCAAIFHKCNLSAEYGAFLGGLSVGILYDKESAYTAIRTITKLISIAFFVFIGTKPDVGFILHNLVPLSLFACFVFITKTFVNWGAIYALSGSKKSMYSGLMLSTLSELSFSLINTIGSTAIATDEFVIKFIESLVIICIFLSSFWIKSFLPQESQQ